MLFFPRLTGWTHSCTPIYFGKYIVPMNLAQLKQHLMEHAGSNIRFLLPDGQRVATHAHVTEVARIDKQFVDCGGTFRSQALCRMQTWVSDDFHHRLTAGTLLGILQKAAPFLRTDDIEVDIEHQLAFITQFPLDSVRADGSDLVLTLAERRTECLAPDQCKRPPSILERPNPLKFQFTK